MNPERPLSSVFPLLDGWRAQAVAVGLCLVLAMLGSEWLLRWYVKRYVRQAPAEAGESPTDAAGVGRIIGKCENIIIFTLVCIGSFDGLGMVLAAKSIARMEAIRKNPSYYLGGTLLNFVWSMLAGLLARALAIGRV